MTATWSSASRLWSTRRSSMMTIVVPGASCAAVFFAGGLIHTARGKSAGCDRPLTKRSGCAAYAAASTCWRCARTVGAWPKCTTAGVRNPRPLWRCSWLYQGKKTCPNARPSSSDPKRSGNCGQYLSVLKQHRRPRQAPDGWAERAFDERAIERFSWKRWTGHSDVVYQVCCPNPQRWS